MRRGCDLHHGVVQGSVGVGGRCSAGVVRLLVRTLSYRGQSELGCRNTLWLLPCKGRQRRQQPVAAFKQDRRVMYYRVAVKPWCALESSGVLILLLAQ